MIKALNPGNYGLTVKFSGYQEYRYQDLGIGANSISFVNVELHESTIDMKPVIVSGGKKALTIPSDVVASISAVQLKIMP